MKHLTDEELQLVLAASEIDQTHAVMRYREITMEPLREATRAVMTLLNRPWHEFPWLRNRMVREAGKRLGLSSLTAKMLIEESTEHNQCASCNELFDDGVVKDDKCPSCGTEGSMMSGLHVGADIFVRFP